MLLPEKDCVGTGSFYLLAEQISRVTRLHSMVELNRDSYDQNNLVPMNPVTLAFALKTLNAYHS